MPPKPPSMPNSGASSRVLRRFSRNSEDAAAAPPPGPVVEHFWRATAETSVFVGPLGAECGEVPEGTVVRELARYLDPWNTTWVATSSSDESIVWIRIQAEGPMAAEPVALWELVAEEGSDPADLVPVVCEKYDTEHSPLELPAQADSDLEFCEWYCKNSPQYNQQRDWNTEYQKTLEAIMFNTGGDSGDRLRAHLAQLVKEFCDEVEGATAKLVKQMYAQPSERTIQKHPSAVDVYYHNNIMLRLCIDTAGTLGGDTAAQKVATQYYRSAVLLSNEAPKHFLAVPMNIIMSYRGHRVRASMIPPVTESGICCGPPTAEGGNVIEPQPMVAEFMESLGRALNLKPHAVPGSERTQALPIETQVVQGLDERLYLFNFGRLMPPLAPSQHGQNIAAAAKKSLGHRFRPEIINELDRVVSCDAFVPGVASVNDNDEILTMTQWIRDSGIPTVAGILGLLQSFNALGDHHHPDAAAPEGQPVPPPHPEDLLTFVVCLNKEECCRISSEKYFELVMAFLRSTTEEEYEAAGAQLIECVKCNAGHRGVNGFLVKPDITTLMHMNGISLRYLSFVYNRIPISARPCTAHYLEIEMIARSAKAILLRKMRVVRDEEELLTICKDFYAALLGADSDASRAFWEKELGPEIQRSFDVFVPFNSENTDQLLVYSRAADLTGIRLSEASVDTIGSDEVQIELSIVHPIMKMVHVPELVSNVGGHEPHLRANLAKLLLYWTGVGSPPAEYSEKVPDHLQEEDDASASK